MMMVGVLVEALPRPHDDGELRQVADLGATSAGRCASGCWIRQRARIETMFSVMKSHMGFEHSCIFSLRSSSAVCSLCGHGLCLQTQPA
jgi:hypothetical protein